MSNPLSLLPYALAAGGGTVDGVPASALAAAGFTLLQRSAALVRALAGRRSAILLPSSGATLVALAASDGRGAVLLDPEAAPAVLADWLDHGDVGAVFTMRRFAARLPIGERAMVLLDGAPRQAHVVIGGIETVVELGSHFGLTLEGEEAPGRDEECVIAGTGGTQGASLGAVLSHRSVLAAARGAVDAMSMLKTDQLLAALPPSDLVGLTVTLAAPLLVGARVTTVARHDTDAQLHGIETDGVTMLADRRATYQSLAAALEARGEALHAPALRVCLCADTRVNVALQERWHALTGAELRAAYGLAEAPLCLFNAPHFPNRRGTLGIPFPGMQVSIRNVATGAALPSGAPGALCVRGDQVMSGYLRAAPAGRVLRDGWLYTGEQARERADGTFELV